MEALIKDQRIKVGIMKLATYLWRSLLEWLPMKRESYHYQWKWLLSCEDLFWSGYQWIYNTTLTFFSTKKKKISFGKIIIKYKKNIVYVWIVLKSTCVCVSHFFFFWEERSTFSNVGPMATVQEEKVKLCFSNGFMYYSRDPQVIYS